MTLFAVCTETSVSWIMSFPISETKFQSTWGECGAKVLNWRALRCSVTVKVSVRSREKESRLHTEKWEKTEN